MTQPAIYAGSAAIGGGALVLGLMEQSAAAASDTSVAQITAYGVIVLGIIAGIPIILAAWGSARAAAAKADEAAATAKMAVIAAESAAALAQKNLDKTEEVAVKVNGHWSDIEKRLNAADHHNRELIDVVKGLTAKLAVADQAAAVAGVEKAGALEAVRVKELADAKAAPAEER